MAMIAGQLHANAVRGADAPAPAQCVPLLWIRWLTSSVLHNDLSGMSSDKSMTARCLPGRVPP